MAGIKIVALALLAVVLLLAASWLAALIGSIIWKFYIGLFGLWILFALFTFYFFRDPDPMTPTGANLVVSPGHGTIDVIDTVAENEFMGGECKRISIFLSVFNVHVQNAPRLLSFSLKWIMSSVSEATRPAAEGIGKPRKSLPPLPVFIAARQLNRASRNAPHSK